MHRRTNAAMLASSRNSALSLHAAAALRSRQRGRGLRRENIPVGRRCSLRTARLCQKHAAARSLIRPPARRSHSRPIGPPAARWRSPFRHARHPGAAPIPIVRLSVAAASCWARPARLIESGGVAGRRSFAAPAGAGSRRTGIATRCDAPCWPDPDPTPESFPAVPLLSRPGVAEAESADGDPHSPSPPRRAGVEKAGPPFPARHRRRSFAMLSTDTGSRGCRTGTVGHRRERG